MNKLLIFIFLCIFVVPSDAANKKFKAAGKLVGKGWKKAVGNKAARKMILKQRAKKKFIKHMKH